MEDTKPLITENGEFQYRDDTLYLALFGIPDCQYSNARPKIGKMPIENVFTTEKLLIETLIEKMENAVMGDK